LYAMMTFCIFLSGNPKHRPAHYQDLL